MRPPRSLFPIFPAARFRLSSSAPMEPSQTARSSPSYGYHIGLFRSREARRHRLGLKSDDHRHRLFVDLQRSNKRSRYALHIRLHAFASCLCPAYSRIVARHLPSWLGRYKGVKSCHHKVVSRLSDLRAVSARPALYLSTRPWIGSSELVKLGNTINPE